MSKEQQIKKLVNDWNFSQVSDNSLVCDNGPWFFEIYFQNKNKIELTVRLLHDHKYDECDVDVLSKTYKTLNGLLNQLCEFSGCNKF